MLYCSTTLLSILLIASAPMAQASQALPSGSDGNEPPTCSSSGDDGKCDQLSLLQSSVQVHTKTEIEDGMQALDEKEEKLQFKNELQGEDEDELQVDAKLQAMFRQIHGPKLLETRMSVKTAGKVNETADQGAVESATTFRQAKLNLMKLLDDMDETTFDYVVGTFLAVSIYGYPDAVRSVIAQRNEILRNFGGDEVAAAWDNTWFIIPEPNKVVQIVLKLVPRAISVSHDIVRYLWYSLRDTCLLAALMGYDMAKDETLQIIISAFVGVQASKVGGIVMSKVAHGAWMHFHPDSNADIESGMRALLGPQAGKKAYKVLLPSCPWYYAAFACPTDDIKQVPAHEYNKRLDDEPSALDRAWVLTKLAVWSLSYALGRSSENLYEKIMHTINAIMNHPDA